MQPNITDFETIDKVAQVKKTIVNLLNQAINIREDFSGQAKDNPYFSKEDILDEDIFCAPIFSSNYFIVKVDISYFRVRVKDKTYGIYVPEILRELIFPANYSYNVTHNDNGSFTYTKYGRYIASKPTYEVLTENLGENCHESLLLGWLAYDEDFVELYKKVMIDICN